MDFYYKNIPLYKAPFYVWGIINLTPDSFYDGGKHANQGIAHAQKCIEDGAAILDIGGASSRPNAHDVPAHEEWKRIEPVVKYVAHLSSDVFQQNLEKHENSGLQKGIIPFCGEFERQSLSKNLNTSPLISIDTWRADVAQKALEAGAHIINDISAFAWEEKLLDVVSEHKCGYVLMHCQGRPQTMQDCPSYSDIIQEVRKFFETKMNMLVKKGLPESHIILDLGIGFGKNTNHNLALLQGVNKFIDLKRPLLLGVSHKSFFGKLLGVEPDKRASITQVCTALMMEKGVLHHRVHDVLETVQSLQLAQFLNGEKK